MAGLAGRDLELDSLLGDLEHRVTRWVSSSQMSFCLCTPKHKWRKWKNTQISFILVFCYWWRSFTNFYVLVRTEWLWWRPEDITQQQQQQQHLITSQGQHYHNHENWLKSGSYVHLFNFSLIITAWLDVGLKWTMFGCVVMLWSSHTMVN